MSKNISALLDVTIRTVTPLHIGTGESLLRDYDYVTQDGKTFIVNDEELAGALYDAKAEKYIGDRASVGLGILFPNKQAYPVDSPVFRYVMSGTPNTEATGSEIQEQMKDIWNMPYIPGSSLKGAIRTALMYRGVVESKKTFSKKDLGKNAKFAAQPYEQEFLVGRDEHGIRKSKTPYFDLLRALQVNDSAPVGVENLRLINLKVAQKGEADGSPINIEAIAPGVEFKAKMKLDLYLLEEQAKEIGWSDEQVQLLRSFTVAMKMFTLSRLNNDAHQRGGKWLENHNKVVDFATNGLKRGQFLVQLGFGGGWSSNTLGDHLTQNESEFASLVNDREYRMLKSTGRNKATFQIGDRYPKSVRVVVNEEQQPIHELGWVKVTVEKAE